MSLQSAKEPLIEAGARVAPDGAGEMAAPHVPDPHEDGLSHEEAKRLLGVHGFNELASKEPTPILDFLKNFWGPMPIMIWIAIIVEVIPKPEGDPTKPDEPSWADFGVLLTLQIVNGLVGWYGKLLTLRRQT